MRIPIRILLYGDLEIATPFKIQKNRSLCIEKLRNGSVKGHEEWFVLGSANSDSHFTFHGDLEIATPCMIRRTVPSAIKQKERFSNFLQISLQYGLQSFKPILKVVSNPWQWFCLALNAPN